MITTLILLLSLAPHLQAFEVDPILLKKLLTMISSRQQQQQQPLTTTTPENPFLIIPPAPTTNLNHKITKLEHQLVAIRRVRKKFMDDRQKRAENLKTVKTQRNITLVSDMARANRIKHISMTDVNPQLISVLGDPNVPYSSVVPSPAIVRVQVLRTNPSRLPSSNPDNSLTIHNYRMDSSSPQFRSVGRKNPLTSQINQLSEQSSTQVFPRLRRFFQPQTSSPFSNFFTRVFEPRPRFWRIR